jgi:hypothetical protein
LELTQETDMTTSPVSSRGFSPDLAPVPQRERIVEAFGWAPASWALICITFSILVASQPAKPDTTEIVEAGVSLVAGCLLGFHEIRRRRHPKVVVRNGSSLALYIRGTLDREVAVEAVQLTIRHPGRTWGPILMTALATVAATIFLLPGGLHITAADRIFAGMTSLCFASLCGTLIRTRLFCEEALLPYDYGNTRRSQHLLVLKRDIPRIFRRTP